MLTKLDQAAVDSLKQKDPEKYKSLQKDQIVFIKGGEVYDLTEKLNRAHGMSFKELEKQSPELMADVNPKIQTEVADFLRELRKEKQWKEKTQALVAKNNDPEKRSRLMVKLDVTDPKQVAEAVAVSLSGSSYQSKPVTRERRKLFEQLAMDRSEVKWKVRDKEIPRGPMALTPRQAKIIATKSDLGYSEKDLLNNDFENVEGAVWLIEKYYKQKYKNTSDPIGFALMALFIEESGVEKAQKLAEEKEKGTKINFDLVLKKLPIEFQKIIKKFLPEKRERG